MRFQDLWLLQKLASWIIDPTFRGLVNEGREDVDTFWFESDRRTTFRTERWQMKDRLVTKALLAEVLAGFARQAEERKALGKEPIFRFHLVAPASDQSIWTLPEVIDRVSKTRIAYGPRAAEYLASMEDLGARLKKLGIHVDAGFICDRVDLDFRAGWAQSNQDYWTTLHALLRSLGVAADRARDAANDLFVSVSNEVGALLERNEIMQRLGTYFAPPPAARAPARRKPATRVTSGAAPALGAGSHCLVSYFPDESVFLQFADGTCGLIDCGPVAIRHIVPYLSKHSIDRLSFLAVSHWDFTHYVGIPALLNAVSRIERIHLTLEADTNSPVIKAAARDPRQPMAGFLAHKVISQMVQRARKDGTKVQYGAGLSWIHRPNRDADSDFLCAISPTADAYRWLGRMDKNSRSAVFLARIAGRQLLLGGEATTHRWPGVLATAREADLPIRADGFLLPNYASRRTLTPALIKELVNPNGFVGLLPVSDFMNQRYGNITSQDVLDGLRAAGGRIVVIDGKEPTHFAINKEGLFQALSPAATMAKQTTAKSAPRTDLL
jgi:hypothetical protein